MTQHTNFRWQHAHSVFVKPIFISWATPHLGVSSKRELLVWLQQVFFNPFLVAEATALKLWCWPVKSPSERHPVLIHRLTSEGGNTTSYSFNTVFMVWRRCTLPMSCSASLTWMHGDVYTRRQRAFSSCCECVCLPSVIVIRYGTVFWMLQRCAIRCLHSNDFWRQCCLPEAIRIASIASDDFDNPLLRHTLLFFYNACKVV